MYQPNGTQDQIRVAIVGAGIVGLILAVTLNTLDTEHRISIDIYESSSKLSQIGAGINIWPRSWQIFQEIGPGLGEALKPFFDHYPDFELRPIWEARKSDQKDGFKVTDLVTKGLLGLSLSQIYPFTHNVPNNTGGALRIHRADFQRCLVDHLPLPSNESIPKNSPCTLHLSHRLVDYITSSPNASRTSTGPITLHFSDKPPRTCDILIGADGIKSTVRKLFLSRLPDPEDYARCMDPVWSGAMAYRGLIEKEQLESVYPGHRALGHPGLLYFGKNKHTVAYPISGGRYINIVAVIHDLSKEGTAWDANRPWNEEVSQQEFFDHFKGWDDEFMALIKCIKRPTKWALQSMNHLDTFAAGGVFLMGDAAHAMLPYQGAGAAVGIDDAYIFASLLTHPSAPRTLSSSTRFLTNLTTTYNHILVPHAHGLSDLSASQGHHYTLQLPEFDAFKEGDEEIPRWMMEKTFRTAERNWLWCESDAGDERKAAVGMLGSLIEVDGRMEKEIMNVVSISTKL